MTHEETNRRPRDYTARDFDACMALFDSNIDPFFLPEERPEFAAYLKEPPEAFLVIEEQGQMIACGGYAVSKEGVATFCWGMVHRAYHGKGVGRSLSEHRLALIAGHPDVREVQLHTSQHTSGFYQKLGFVITDTKENGYGPGLHRQDMVLKKG